jgi:hypothetical protein
MQMQEFSSVVVPPDIEMRIVIECKLVERFFFLLMISNYIIDYKWTEGSKKNL